MTSARLVSDTCLELLARRLRILGFDVETHRGATLEKLFDRARREERTVLTPSVRHPRRWADVPALVVPRDDPAAALRAVAGLLAPTGAPFSRCAVCNRTLEPADPSLAWAGVPAGIRERGAPVRRCPRCGRCYWHGSHVDRLREWLEQALGRPVPAP